MRIFSLKISFTRTLLAVMLLVMAVGMRAQTQDPQGLSASNDNKVKVEVFPNPTTNYLTVDLSKLSLRDPKIEIRNIIGSKMVARTEKVGGIGSKQYRVDVQDYPRGYYLVLVRDDQSQFQQTVRFSKK